METKRKKYVFFLGGRDLEMVTIREKLINGEFAYFDKKLDWEAARASEYATEITMATKNGATPVLVELEINIALPIGAIDINHHGDRSNEPASILQVLQLVGQEPTRDDLLVAANDSGYIPGLISAGAKPEEIVNIRYCDRAAQGVTQEMEVAAELAINRAFTTAGGLKLVFLPHDKPSTVTDRLYSTWPDGKENLLVVCEKNGEYVVYYFGRGDLCKLIAEKFDGFSGGKGFGHSDQNAFAGQTTDNPTPIIRYILSIQQ